MGILSILKEGNSTLAFIVHLPLSTIEHDHDIEVDLF
jgi:hypothetical protein